MPVPAPRTPADDDPLGLDPRREIFLQAMAHMWDTSRAAAKAHMTHGAAMIMNRLGGTLLLRAESSISKKGPEAGFQSEGFSLLDR